MKKGTLFTCFKVVSVFLLLVTAGSLKAQRDYFDGVIGDVWLDTDGNPIQAHGGQVQKIGDKWWWIGEDKEDGYRTQNGISMYSSDDLYNWKFEGYVLRALKNRAELDDDPYFIELYSDLSAEEKDEVYAAINTETSVIERPKMLYNEKTGKYLLWFHADGPTREGGSNYAVAAAGVAIADSPKGPFKFIKRSRLHQLPAEDYGEEWYESEDRRGMARDMNLFKDDDGTGYIIYSSEENMTMFISRLNEEYTDLDVAQTPVGLAKEGVDFVRLFPGAQREAPAMFKYNGKYYMITSGATGWSPNKARYWVADEIFGEWTNMGDPCVSESGIPYPANLTFRTQSTNVIPVDPANGKFIYMGDRWIDSDLGDSRYVWLPIYFTEEGIELRSVEYWNLGSFGMKYDRSQFEAMYINNTDLPAKITVQMEDAEGWKDQSFDLSWDDVSLLPPGALLYMQGRYTVNNSVQRVRVKAVNMPRGLLYFIDCAAVSGSDLYSALEEKQVTPYLINTDTYDQKYEDGVTWGFLGSPRTDLLRYESGSKDAATSSWLGLDNKPIQYKLKLSNGDYRFTAGFKEWRGLVRNIKISVSYKNAEGAETAVDLGTFSNEGESTQDYKFSVENLDENDPYITVSFTKASGDAEPIVSWFAITDNNISDTSNSEISSDNNLFSVYPTLISRGETVCIQVENGGLNEVKVYDIQGKLMMTQKISGEVATLNLNLSSGIYFINIANRVEKIVIN